MSAIKVVLTKQIERAIKKFNPGMNRAARRRLAPLKRKEILEDLLKNQRRE